MTNPIQVPGTGDTDALLRERIAQKIYAAIECSTPDARKAAAIAVAALSPDRGAVGRVPAVPAGWKLVPVQATMRMLQDGTDAPGDRRPLTWEAKEPPEYLAWVWKVMLDAAPSPPVPDSGWRPIRTAKKDDTERLLGRWCDGEWIVTVGFFERGPADRCWYDSVSAEVLHPTHHAPIPSAPPAPVPGADVEAGVCR